jgi:putative ABC transport system permease protein
MSTLSTKLRRDLRRSRTQFIAVAATIFLGVTLFGATYDAYRSLKASYEQVFEDVSFADYWITGGDSAAAGAAAMATDGVAAVVTRERIDLPMRPVPDHALFGRVVGLPTTEPAVDSILILDGTMFDPTRSDEVVVEQHTAEHFHLAPGDEVMISAPDGWRSFTVTGIASSAEYLWPSPSRQQIISSLDDFGVVFASDAIVDSLTAGSASTDVLVRYRSGADRTRLDDAMAGIADDVGAVDAYSRANQPSNSALQEDVSGFGELSFMFPVLFLTAAGIGTWVMLTRLVMTQMSVIGTLMASGMRRRTIFGHYLGYGVVVGLVGAIPGVIAGALLAWLIAGVYTSAISVPITVLAIDATTPLTGLAFGLFTGVAAAAFPAWRAVRRAPAEAMRGVYPSGTAHRTLAERLIPPLRRLPATGAMVLRGITRNARRTVTTILGVVLALMLILVSWGMIDTVDGLIGRQFDQIEGSDARVVLDRVPDSAALAAIASIPGVAAVEPTLSATVAVEADGRRYTTELEAFMGDTTMHRFLSSTGIIALPATGVLLGDDMHSSLGVDIGDVVTITPSGLGTSFSEPVAGFVDEPLGTYAYVSLGELASQVSVATGTTGIVPGAAVRFVPGADPTAMRRALQGADGVLAISGTRAFEATLKSFLGLFYAFVGVMLVFGSLLAFAIIFNTMSVNLAERTVEVATLKASGMTDHRYARLISAENLIVTVIGLAPGLVIGYYAAAEFMAAYSNDQFSFDLMMRPTTLAFSALAIVVVTLLAQIPGLRAIRRLNIAAVVRERAV